MFNTYSLWKNIFLLFFSSIYLTIVLSNQRTNLAQRHPCYSINKRLEPYIKWTEKLVSTQYRVQKDACGQTPSTGPTCCTNEIFNSYALSLGDDLKALFDTKLNQLKQLLTEFNKQIDHWTKEYLRESHHLTISSLEILFGTKEYHSNIHHSLINLFNILDNHQSTSDNVSKSVINLLNHLIISTYRRFMTNKSDLIFDEQFEKCLVNTATSIDALPTQRELLYTITSAASLIHILRTLFIYIDADIQRLKTSVILNSHECIQRYVRETLCPICVSIPLSFSSSIHYDNNINEPLCENDCHYVIKNCFNQTSNPYVAFALIAQGYSNVTKQIQESVVELKLVERLSKLHIYLYDMVINVTNTRRTYMTLQSTCPHQDEKVFSPIISLSPTTTERREFVTQWNTSLHSMLDKLQLSIDNLNKSLTQQIITDICLNSNYAVKSNRCRKIDQHTPADLSQWPIPSIESNLPITLNLNDELTQNQIDDLNKKLEPIEQMIISLRPKKKFSFWEYLPNLEYDDDIDTNNDDSTSVSSIISEKYEIENTESLTDKLFKQFDQKPILQVTTAATTTTTTTIDFPEEKNMNHSQSLRYNIISYLIIFVSLIIYQISFINK